MVVANEEGDRVDIVVKGRHTDVAERFRGHAEDKLAKVVKLDGKVSRIDVEVCEEPTRVLLTSARASS